MTVIQSFLKEGAIRVLDGRITRILGCGRVRFTLLKSLLGSTEQAF